MPRLWAGVDAGKSQQHCVVIDAGGRELLSRRVADDWGESITLISDVGALGDEEATWATDLNHRGASLRIALPAPCGQEVFHIPNRPRPCPSR